jgi:branched-chain amino acid transport system substrate-binding protein
VVKAIESAGTVDPDKVRAALTKLNFQSLYGTVAFGKNGQITLPQTVIQIQDEKVVPVYGKDGFIKQPKYPMPAWDSR